MHQNVYGVLWVVRPLFSLTHTPNYFILSMCFVCNKKIVQSICKSVKSLYTAWPIAETWSLDFVLLQPGMA